MRTRGKKEAPGNSSKVLFFAGALVALVFGLVQAHAIRWLSDDVFITLRYVKNWLAGSGIVYNAGERVEGYTHFLWLCIVALFDYLGFSPTEAVQWLGLIAFGCTIVLHVGISWKLQGKAVGFLPLSALMLAFNYDFRVWATSGLETSLFTFLVSLSIYVLFFWDVPRRTRLVAAGLTQALVALTRPDGALFGLVTACFLIGHAWSTAHSWKRVADTLLLYGVPIVLFCVPYFLWRLVYYQDFFPNTYYAKSGGLSYYSQGFLYLWIYLRSYVSSWIFLIGAGLLAAIAWEMLRQQKGSALLDVVADRELGTIVLGLSYVLVYGILFIARVGGDFMFARFIIPLVPIFYIVGEIALRRLLARRMQYLRIVMIILAMLVLFEKTLRDSIYMDETGKRNSSFGEGGITDEQWYWSKKEADGLDKIQANEALGRQLKTYFRGEHVSVLLKGQASLGYYGEFSECIENAGLTDRYIAHLPISNRGRPGHEKNAPLEYLERRGVNFVFWSTVYDTAVYRHMYFLVRGEYVRAEMFFYDGTLLKNLRSRFGNNVRFIDFDAYLVAYIHDLDKKSPPEIERDYARFKSFYFAHNPDPAKEERILEHLRRMSHN
jgi:hypothetical protein